MTLQELTGNYLFKHPEILADGATADSVKKAMAGLESELSGLSEKELTSVIESTKPLQSYTDKQRTEGIATREKTLKSEHDTEIRKSEETIKTLKGRIPMSADPAELRKQAESETDDTKRTLLLLKADNIENKQTLEEQKALSATKDAELQRERLINLAKEKLGDRKIPKSIRLESFLGADEATTTEAIEAFNTEWDDFTKDMKTAKVETSKPPGGDNDEATGEEAMNEKLSNMSFLD